MRCTQTWKSVGLKLKMDWQFDVRLKWNNAIWMYQTTILGYKCCRVWVQNHTLALYQLKNSLIVILFLKFTTCRSFLPFLVGIDGNVTNLVNFFFVLFYSVLFEYVCKLRSCLFTFRHNYIDFLFKININFIT